MKKIIVILILVLITIILGAFLRYSQERYTSITVESPPEPTADNPQWNTILVGEKTYAYNFFRVSDISSITLIPNFVTRISSKNLMTQYNCSQGINAGFYDKEYKPLGLFVTDKKTFGSALQSALLNGFFTIDDANRAVIQPTNNGASHVALQSGPLLMLDEKPLLLKIKNDEFARRSIAAVSKNGDILFFSLFFPDSDISGPLLQNLPNILMEINTDQKLGITDALNLDGGSASFFKGERLYIEELTTVGGVFCIRE
ncbi:MAG: phosphodiester glycosidase family protein [Patescibacteria group bacterium]